MAQAAIQMDQEKVSCSVCLDLLKDPVTIPCGHSYCMSCIQEFWDEKRTYSCPQCRRSFTPRPVLMKNTVLADLVEELKKVELADAPPHHSYAGPADVSCDFCVGRKMKAIKSCLACMASYCELHLQPHFNVAPLKKHKLVEASSKLQDNICPRHDEVMKIFCRTDGQCICYLCSMDEHKGHDTVSAAAERAERQTELGVDRRNIQQRIQDREKDVKVTQQRLESIEASADEAVSDSEKIFKDLICLIEKKSSEVKQKIRSQQKTDESRVRELQEKMQQEISELRRKDTELEKLSSTEDHLHFLSSYSRWLHLNETAPISHDFTVQYYEKMTAAVSEARDKLKALLSDEWPKITLREPKVEVLQPPKDNAFPLDLLSSAYEQPVFRYRFKIQGTELEPTLKVPEALKSHRKLKKSTRKLRMPKVEVIEEDLSPY
ncbi:E3 ubiquitin/ISG15 ligase TRIM25-like [Acanthochromis polyacanthus]|uniref:E3 ubiquitin/ISG15 ligase TRIM25-like n=1 Tax=Acanthochromis polyacanthus TaxID=80966 RepID=UPI0022341C1A|nr:E3 ubiquitin/ISG15 ligase TRIM25-like [Acanthochromis polyacanthus]